MADRICLRAIRVLAYCGVLDEEQARRQPFEIDLDIEADLTAPGESDNLEHTINYGEVLSRIDSAVAQDRFLLLEKFAQAVADIVLEYPIADAVTVTVRKLRPPVPQDLDSTGVCIRREK